jgi:hypothetical protein
MTNRGPKRAFVAGPRDPDTWVRAPEPSASQNGTKADQFTAQLTIDATPELRGGIKGAAFGRGITVAEMLRDLLTREFTHHPGDTA